jgi:uncharacterized protein (TIGR02001 family)
MKLLNKATLAATLVASTLMATHAQADLSANVGLMSEYHFRGIVQNGTASAMGGLDYEDGGFYAGVWGADVEDGLEIDLYGGYAYELDSGLALSAGVTTYLYTGDFDSRYDEINLGASFGMFSLEYTIGEQADDLGLGINEASYTFTGLSFEHEGFSGTVGSFAGDFEGEYAELGYGFELNGFDIGVAVVISGSDLDDDESVYFTIGKSFSL